MTHISKRKIKDKAKGGLIKVDIDCIDQKSDSPPKSEDLNRVTKNPKEVAK